MYKVSTPRPGLRPEEEAAQLIKGTIKFKI